MGLAAAGPWHLAAAFSGPFGDDIFKGGSHAYPPQKAGAYVEGVLCENTLTVPVQIQAAIRRGIQQRAHTKAPKWSLVAPPIARRCVAIKQHHFLERASVSGMRLQQTRQGLRHT